MTNVSRKRMEPWLFRVLTVGVLAAVAVSVGNPTTRAYAGPPSSPPIARMWNKIALYAGFGNELTEYDADFSKPALTMRSSIKLPGNIQEATAAPSRRFLYAAWSNGGASYVLPAAKKVPPADKNGVSAFRIDPGSGKLVEVGQPAMLPARPIYVTVDMSSTHLLVAIPEPSQLLVFNLGADGSIGGQIKQPAPLDVGIYAHQVRVDPSNRMAILVTRGNAPVGNKPEDPGAIKVFNYNNGTLTNRASIAPGGGFNFQSRHLDFHPSGPWIYLTLERQNKLTVWKKQSDGTLGPQPLFVKDTLSNTSHVPPSQWATTVHVHPTGKFVYVGNRGYGTQEFHGSTVSADGENSIAAFSINLQTGEPTLIQTIDTRGLSPRTFSIDPSGQILVAANQVTLGVRNGDNIKTVPASLAVFRIGNDGKLTFVRKYDMRPGISKQLWWVGLLALPFPYK